MSEAELALLSVSAVLMTSLSRKTKLKRINAIFLEFVRRSNAVHQTDR